VVFLDGNQIQLDNFVKKVLDIEPVITKWQAFGWPVIEIDGHDIGQIAKALDQAEATRGKPTFVVAHTVKGKACPSWRTIRSGTARRPSRPRRSPPFASARRGCRRLEDY